MSESLNPEFDNKNNDLTIRFAGSMLTTAFESFGIDDFREVVNLNPPPMDSSIVKIGHRVYLSERNLHLDVLILKDVFVPRHQKTDSHPYDVTIRFVMPSINREESIALGLYGLETLPNRSTDLVQITSDPKSDIVFQYGQAQTVGYKLNSPLGKITIDSKGNIDYEKRRMRRSLYFLPITDLNEYEEVFARFGVF